MRANRQWQRIGQVAASAALATLAFAGPAAAQARLDARYVATLAGLPIGEGSPVEQAIQRPWLLPLVVGLGGLFSGILVYLTAPEAKGHGTDAAIAAIHHKGGKLRGRVPPIKLVASALTIEQSMNTPERRRRWITVAAAEVDSLSGASSTPSTARTCCTRTLRACASMSCPRRGARVPGMPTPT